MFERLTERSRDEARSLPRKPDGVDGYDLRTLISRYLVNHAWKWSPATRPYAEASWVHADGTTYLGDDATDRAIRRQIEREEGRA
jgi:hypothetical protein